LDPKYAAAYASLAWIYLTSAWNQWSETPRADLEHSSDLARKGLALDDSNSSALALLSDNDWMQRRFEQAVADGERAVALSPNFAQGYVSLSDALVNDRKPEEALHAAQKAMRLDPANQDLYAYAVGNAYNQMGRYQEAIQVLEKTLAAYPNLLVAHLAIIVAYAELGRDQDARAEAAQVMRISPQFALPPPETSWTRDVAWNKRIESDLRRVGLR
jgi:adenylate cyclase